MRHKRKGRVYGPYEEADGWRVVGITRTGDRLARVFTREEEGKAHEFARLLREELDQEPVTVTAAIERYREHRLSAVQPQSAATERHRLRAFFAGELDTEVGELTEKRCAAAYERLIGANAVDTHRNTLTTAKAFLGWCKSQRMSTANPLAEVTGRGRRRQGKERLRIDEARAFHRVALERARGGDKGALAALLALVLGLRAHEVVGIAARDVDDEGRLLWVPKSKTRAGVRQLEIPDALREVLVPLVPKSGPLFVARGGHAKGRDWVLDQVKRLCRLAEVTPVTAHGLRGTHATLALPRGTSGQAVAAALQEAAASLGHADGGRTAERHYIDPVVAEVAKRRAALRVLEGGR